MAAVRLVSIVGGPVPYREALSTRMVDRGWRVITDAPSDSERSAAVVVHYCDTESGWSDVETTAASDALGVVAVIMTLDPALYRRALSVGAGVVHHDTSTEIMAQVIESAGHGEALVPMHVARQLVTERDTAPSTGVAALTTLESDLLRGVIDGETMVALAERFHFSERTIRRRLQSAYLKLGVDDRTGAIRLAERDGLLG